MLFQHGKRNSSQIACTDDLQQFGHTRTVNESVVSKPSFTAPERGVDMYDRQVSSEQVRSNDLGWLCPHDFMVVC
jgi:hypothetical protein